MRAAERPLPPPPVIITGEGGSLLNPFRVNYHDIEFGKSIGEGAFGTVYAAELNGKPVAVKTVRATRVSEITVHDFLGEARIMASLKHANLVNLLGVVWEDGPDKLCLVLEFAGRGSFQLMLKDRENTWSTGSHRGLMPTAPPRGQSFKPVAFQVVSCFRYLHEMEPEPIIHRDLKPENVLIMMDWTAKVADFGESRRFDVKESMETDDGLITMTMCGTPTYCAPEILNGHGRSFLFVRSMWHLTNQIYFGRHSRSNHTHTTSNSHDDARCCAAQGEIRYLGRRVLLLDYAISNGGRAAGLREKHDQGPACNGYHWVAPAHPGFGEESPPRFASAGGGCLGS